MKRSVLSIFSALFFSVFAVNAAADLIPVQVISNTTALEGDLWESLRVVDQYGVVSYTNFSDGRDSTGETASQVIYLSYSSTVPYYGTYW
jgi:hypothetical protein